MYMKYRILALLVPHFAPSGTRPAIMSDPGTVVKDLGKIYRTLSFEGIRFYSTSTCCYTHTYVHITLLPSTITPRDDIRTTAPTDKRKLLRLAS